MQLALPLPEDTRRLACALAGTLGGTETIALRGPLGAGKTFFVRELCLALGVRDNVSSPSYVLLHEYDAPGYTVHHFDLYRLESEEEVWELGLRELLGQGLVLIEWPELALPLLPAGTIHIGLQHAQSGRTAQLHGPAEWLGRLEALWREA